MVVCRIFLQQENWRRAIWDFCNDIGHLRDHQPPATEGPLTEVTAEACVPWPGRAYCPISDISGLVANRFHTRVAFILAD